MKPRTLGDPSPKVHIQRRIVCTISCATCLALSLIFVLTSSAQSWQQKDWKQWTAAECDEILTAPPWSAYEEPQDPEYFHMAIVISSLVVRRAIFREMQINHNYDKMSPKKQESFDKEVANCLGKPMFKNNIVIRVWGGSPGKLNVSDRVKVGPNDSYPAYLTCGPGSQKPGVLDSMNDPPYSVPLHGTPIQEDKTAVTQLQPVSPGNVPRTPHPVYTNIARDYLYSRSINGQPLIRQGDDKLVFNLGPKGGVFSFSISKMVYQGKPDF
ncbi:MAG: hypothetical protein WAM91_04655 [Candidatus Acidiferrales bacterium]